MWVLSQEIVENTETNLTPFCPPPPKHHELLLHTIKTL